MAPVNVTWRNDSYVPDPFRNTMAIKRMHAAPRFGHSNDIQSLIAPNAFEEERKDYVIGVLICSILILCLVTIWTIILVVLKLMGRKRAGFLAGTFPPVPPPHPPPKGTRDAGVGNVAMQKSASSHDETYWTKPEVAPTQSLENEQVEVEFSKKGRRQDENHDEQGEISRMSESVKVGRSLRQLGAVKPVNTLCQSAPGALGDNAPKVDDIVCHENAHASHNTHAAELSPEEEWSKIWCKGYEEGVTIHSCAEPLEEKAVSNNCTDESMCKYPLRGDSFEDERANPESTENGETPLQVSIMRSTSTLKDEVQNTPADIADELDNDQLIGETSNDAFDEGRTDRAYMEYIEKVAQVQTLVNRTRIAVLASGLVIIFCSVLFLTMGIDSLMNSLESIEGSLALASRLTNRTLALTQYFLDVQIETKAKISGFLEVAPDVWCPNLQNRTDIEEIMSDWGNITAFFNTTAEEFLNFLNVFQNDLEVILGWLDTINGYVNSFEWAYYVAAGFVAFLDLIVLGTMVGVVLAWRNKFSAPFRCLHKFFFYPLFVITLFMTWLFSSLFILGSIAGADFCYGSPDQNVTYLLETFGLDKLSQFTYEVLLYYISGCAFDLLSDETKEYLMTIVTTALKVHDNILNLLRIPADELATYCGSLNSALGLRAGANLLDEQIHLFIDVALEVREILSCSNVYPVYSLVAHNALCYEGVTGFSWIFSMQFAIAICCMTIVTLRAAWDDATEKTEGTTVNNEKNAYMASEPSTVTYKKCIRRSQVKQMFCCRQARSFSNRNATPGLEDVQSTTD